MAEWRGWRNRTVEAAVVARAIGLAWYSGDPKTAERYLDKIFDVIEFIKNSPEMGRACPQAPGHRSFVIGSPAPGSPDTLVYFFDKTTMDLIGEGVFSSLPPKYR